MDALIHALHEIELPYPAFELPDAQRKKNGHAQNGEKAQHEKLQR